MTRKKGIIISKNLKILEPGEEVEILYKNEKILGKTVKEMFSMEKNQIAIFRRENESSFCVIIISKYDVKII